MTEPMKTAEDILFDHLEGGCLEREELEERKDEPWFEETIKAMDEYAALKVAAERERILSEVRKYVFWHDKFFNDTIVGQPPSLQPLRDLIKD